ncbi:threonyl-tRNA synthetase [uncultured Ferrimonas sp.]|uniref:threonyl-tRNA synthetase n=1 Tax=uncultured Ferrimonas sp. TaxID=432640 RepID=UPI0026269CDC|nr:threonyl-tRNA synthetase [uncultured Ferrimonas sp.]
MDKTILIPSTILAVVMIAVYLFRCYKHGIEPNHAIIVSSVLNASGIICGIALAISPFFPSVKELIGGIDIYIIIGGIAVLFVSTQAISKDVFKSTSKDTANKSIKRDAFGAPY